MLVSTVGTETGATRFPRYAKELQLDGWGVSEDGVSVVLIHKQLCALYQDSVWVSRGA